MALEVNYYELKDPALIRQEFQQIPIFIGTATAKVVVSMKPGVFSLAIPETEIGTQYRDDIFESTVKYWKIFGQGTISSISSTRQEIEIGTPDTDFQTSRQQLSDCVLFIIHDGNVIFSTPMDSLEFTIINQAFFINYAHLLFPLPQSLPTLDCILAYPQTLQNPPYSLSANTVVLSALSNQLTASNLDTIIEASYSFFYDVVDFRWARIAFKDTLPPIAQYSKYNKLGMAAMLHRRVSTTDMTLFTVPSETLSSMQRVLSQIELNPYKYGYSIVPLWIDSSVNNVLASFVQFLEEGKVGFQVTYITHVLKDAETIFKTPLTATNSRTIFERSFGWLYGKDYGRDSD